MIRAILLSVAQLADRAVLWVLAKTLVLTLLLLGLLGAGIVLLADRLGTGWWTGSDRLAAAAGVVVALMLAVLLFRAVAMAVLGLFVDEVVAAVERRHYPDAARTARPVPFARGLRLSLRSLGRGVGGNAAALPAYLLLLPTGAGAPLAFVAANALLLGRDLGEMVGARHLDDAALADRLATSRARRATTGLAVALLFVIPGINLLAPVLGAAIATHRFHGDRR